MTQIEVGPNVAKIIVIAALITYACIMGILGYDGVLQSTIIGIIAFILGISTGKYVTTQP